MRNRTAALLMILLLCSPAYSQKKTARERYGLKGLVRSLTYFRADFYKKGEEWIEKQKTYSSFIEFDREGNRLDNQGNIIKDESELPYFYYCYNDPRIENQNGEDGTRRMTIHITNRASKKYLGKEVRHYDARDRLTELAFFNAEGALTSKNVSTYDERGLFKKTSYYKGDGSLIQIYADEYEVDAAGNWTKCVTTRWYNFNGILKEESKFADYRLISYQP